MDSNRLSGHAIPYIFKNYDNLYFNKVQVIQLPKDAKHRFCLLMLTSV